MDIILAAYFHDLGKLATAGVNPKTGNPTAYGHEKESSKLVQKYSNFISKMGANPENVEYLVASHMKIKPRTWDVMRQKKKDKIQQHSSFSDLEKFTKIDRGGLDLEETQLFSKEWWKNIINENILNEGGAAGHMAHPFDLPQVKSGKDLINVFEKTAQSLSKSPGSVKIDGVNASVRFNGKEFVMDRGSKKELDVKGITKNDLEARFGEGHGMIKSGGETLDILNKSIPLIKPELQKLGMLDDPNVMFNMEYVGGKTNVQDYDKNFLAIHSVMDMQTKEVEGKSGKMLTKRIATEKNVDKNVLKSLIDKVNKVAKKEGFEIYGDVPTNFKRKPDFNSALSKRYTIVDGDQKITKSLKDWLGEINEIPKDKLVTLNGKKMGAVSKAVYMYVLDQDDVSMFDDKKAAIDGAITYLATEKLGDEILKVLDSPMGSVEEHEGVVVRDSNIYDRPFKITGKFILGGMATSFRN